MSCCCGAIRKTNAGAALPLAGALPGQVLVFDGTDAVFGSIPKLYEWQALNAGNSAGGIRWLQAAGSSVAAASTEIVSYRELQLSGTMRKLRVSLFTALPTQITVTWFLNTVAQQALVIAAGLVNGEVAFSTPILAGDLVSMQIVAVAADASSVGIRAYLLQDVP